MPNSTRRLDFKLIVSVIVNIALIALLASLWMHDRQNSRIIASQNVMLDLLKKEIDSMKAELAREAAQLSELHAQIESTTTEMRRPSNNRRD